MERLLLSLLLFGSIQVLEASESKKVTSPVTDELVLESCPICLEDMNLDAQHRILECKHTIHTGCMARWAQTQQAQGVQVSCPLCRLPSLSIQAETRIRRFPGVGFNREIPAGITGRRESRGRRRARNRFSRSRSVSPEDLGNRSVPPTTLSEEEASVRVVVDSLDQADLDDLVAVGRIIEQTQR